MEKVASLVVFELSKWVRFDTLAKNSIRLDVGVPHEAWSAWWSQASGWRARIGKTRSAIGCGQHDAASYLSDMLAVILVCSLA